MANPTDDVGNASLVDNADIPPAREEVPKKEKHGVSLNPSLNDEEAREMAMTSMGFARPLLYYTGLLRLPLPHKFRYFSRIMLVLQSILVLIRVVSLGYDTQYQLKGYLNETDDRNRDIHLTEFGNDLLSIWGLILGFCFAYKGARHMLNDDFPGSVTRVIAVHFQQLAPERRAERMVKLRRHMIWQSLAIYFAITVTSAFFFFARSQVATSDSNTFCVESVCGVKKGLFGLVGYMIFETTTDLAWTSIFGSTLVAVGILFRVQRLTINGERTLERKGTLKRLRSARAIMMTDLSAAHPHSPRHSMTSIVLDEKTEGAGRLTIDEELDIDGYTSSGSDFSSVDLCDLLLQQELTVATGSGRGSADQSDSSGRRPAKYPPSDSIRSYRPESFDNHGRLKQSGSNQTRPQSVNGRRLAEESGRLVIREYVFLLLAASLSFLLWPLVLAFFFTATTTETPHTTPMIVIGPLGLAILSPAMLQLWLLIKTAYVSVVKLENFDEEFKNQTGRRTVFALINRVKRSMRKTASAAQTMGEIVGLMLLSGLCIAAPLFIFAAIIDTTSLGLYLDGADALVLSDSESLTKWWFAFLAGPVVSVFPLFIILHSLGWKLAGLGFKRLCVVYGLYASVFYPVRYLVVGNSSYMRIAGFISLMLLFCIVTLYLYIARRDLGIHRDFLATTLFLLGFASFYTFFLLPRYARATSARERVFIRLLLQTGISALFQLVSALLYSRSRYHPNVPRAYGMINTVEVGIIVVSRFLVTGISNLQQEAILSFLFSLVEVFRRSTNPLRCCLSVMVKRRTLNWPSVIHQADIMTRDEVSAHRILLGMMNEIAAIVVSCLFAIGMGLFHGIPSLVYGGMASLAIQLGIELMCDLVAFRFEETLLKIPLREYWQRNMWSYLVGIMWHCMSATMLFVEFFTASFWTLARQE